MAERAGRTLLSLFVALLATASGAQQMPSRQWAWGEEAPHAFRAPHASSATVKASPEKMLGRPLAEAGGLRVGTVRAPTGVVAEAAWIAVAGGWVARYSLESAGAEGLRAKVSLPQGLADGQILARGDAGEVQGVAAEGALAWTPLTPGARQHVEVFSSRRPEAAPIVEAIVHFDSLPLAKTAAGACSPDVACTSGNGSIDAAIAERRNSVALVSFVEGNEARVCTGTLLNTEKFPAAYLVTANHCIATAAAAASVTTIWFNEAVACGDTTISPLLRQVGGGATLVHTSHGADSTLLQLKSLPPPGAVYSGWNASRLIEGTEVVSISHPQGDVKKFALGTSKADLLVRNYPQEMYGVAFSRGVTEGGSSGSGLYSLSGGSLQLRGVLSGSTFRSGNVLACENSDVEEALYGRFEIFYPQIAAYISAAAPPRQDDYGNRITEAQRIFPVAQAVPSEVAYPGRIDYAGDVDVFRIDVPVSGGTLTVRTEGGMDTVGSLLDASGRAIKGVNDAESSGPDFGLTRTLGNGTYYVAISHHEADGTGDYMLKASISTVDANYTDLWWRPAEPGWGVNINHQGQTLFLTLFTYDAEGNPLWLVAPAVTRQAGGSWQGALLVASGPAFNARPWQPASTETVGTVRIAFEGTSRAQLNYTAFGKSVSREIERQLFSVAPVCRWSAFDRSFTTNFQDLWWNPEEPGWGLNIAHQGSILFITLFTYDEAGKPLWLVTSRAEPIGEGRYQGDLLRTKATPSGGGNLGEVTNSVVGSFSVLFTRGHEGSIAYAYNGAPVVKNIRRQVFSAPATECFAPGED